MEVLSVQNQYQGQFGVIGSTKVKDWTSPLTPPPPAPTRNRSQQRNGSGNNSIVDNNTQSGGDVVDGRQPHHYYQNQHQHHHQHHHHYKQQQQAQQKHAAQLSHSAGTATTAMEAATIVEGSAGARYAYNNNLLCYEPPSQAQPMQALTGDGGSSGGVIVNTAVNSLGNVGAGAVPAAFGVAGGDVDDGAVEELSKRLQEELRAAKSQHLACTEVSLPWDLTPRIAAEIIKTSEREPCGVRGSTIFIEFEDEPNNTRRIASFKVDPHTVSTFELYLTLKHDKSGWTSMLRQFLKNLTRSSTILISPDFTLTKNKLYSCE